MSAPEAATDIFIEDVLNQRAVYWHFEGVGNDGRPLLIDPIEIVCRYEQVTETYINRITNQPEMSRSKVFCDRDLLERGVIWIPPDSGVNLAEGGALAQLVTDDPERAFENPGAYEIQRFDKLPNFDGDEFVRLAFL